MKNFASIVAPAAALAIALVAAQPARAQSAETSFFVTSNGIGNGANLGGLAGADNWCQTLAQAAGAGAKTSGEVKIWRAYLSTQAADGKPAVNARDRIGKGPWQNAKGAVDCRRRHAVRQQPEEQVLVTEETVARERIGRRQRHRNRDDGVEHHIFQRVDVAGIPALVGEDALVVLQRRRMRPQRHRRDDLGIGLEAHVDEPVDRQQQEDQEQPHDEAAARNRMHQATPSFGLSAGAGWSTPAGLGSTAGSFFVCALRSTPALVMTV